MPLNGAHTLDEVRADKVVIECGPCDRRGEYVTARLIQRFGGDMGLPALKGLLVTCPNADPDHLKPCQAVYSRETRMSWQR